MQKALEAILAAQIIRARGLENDQEYLKVLRNCRLADKHRVNENIDMPDRIVSALIGGILRGTLNQYEYDMGDRFRFGTWNATYSGRRIWLLDPRPSEIEIVDIIHGLSRESRFNGGTVGDTPFSVAQHSVMGSFVIEPEYALHFILHDGEEAYAKDLPSPVKKIIGGGYKAITTNLKRAIGIRFGIEWTEDAELAVKAIDNDMLVTEVDQLLPFGIINEVPAYAEIIPNMDLTPWPVPVAEQLYAERLAQLLIERLIFGY